ncbi:MAG: phospholipid/cholesterol/gamma-HCH transport system ATP-binding protein [Candidatus Sumerlaeota bacterium]|nr:phospholipid/cholesterol/gamma-HCH transport system ATP-binding protein [Candidatus Sumerlaeota bacterium]
MAARAPVPMIKIRNVSKAFGNKVVYRDLNLDVEKGETHVIIGRSGEGKSVLLKLLSGLMAPDTGTIEIDGRKIDCRDKESLQYARERVTMVFQMGALFDSLTVRQNVGFFPTHNTDMTPEEIDALCEELLAEVNLPNTGHLLPAELSGGMRKRVGLARALAVRAKIILYDEPTTGLDPVTTEVIGDLMQHANEKHNMTAVVVTHDMRSAYKVGNRISMVHQGEIVFTGTPEEVQNTTHPIVFQFVNGYARGPITDTEQEGVQQLSAELVDRSLLLRRIKNVDETP